MIYLNNRKIEEIKIGEKEVSSNIDLDTRWKEIGYIKEPDFIEKGLLKANEIKSTPITDGFNFGDRDIIFFPKVDLSNVTTFGTKFFQSVGLITASIGKNKATDFAQFFNLCSSLKEVYEFDYGNATDLQYVYSGCSSLKKIPPMNLINVTNFKRAFYNCFKLQDIDLTNTQNITDFSGAFWGCSILKKLKNPLDLSSCTTIDFLFKYCFELQEIEFKGNPANIISMTNPFDSIPYNGTFKYDSRYDYSKIINELNKGDRHWELVPITY